MKSTKDAMLPTPKVVNMSDPEVTRVDPVTDDTEPFMLRQHTDEEVADYDDGFKAGFKGRPNEDAKSEAWQRGWAKPKSRKSLPHLALAMKLSIELACGRRQFE
jgi:hypothetical protein